MLTTPNTETVTLGQLIDTLENRIIAKGIEAVKNGFGQAMSWRGQYNFVAFEPKENTNTYEMYDAAREAVGTTYEGYKGGSFTMKRLTPCYISYYDTSNGYEEDALTEERLKKMLGEDIKIAKKRISLLPERPEVLEIHTHNNKGILGNSGWGIFIPEDTWTAFKEYVCKLESIAAKTEK